MHKRACIFLIMLTKGVCSGQPETKIYLKNLLVFFSIQNVFGSFWENRKKSVPNPRQIWKLQLSGILGLSSAVFLNMVCKQPREGDFLPTESPLSYFLWLCWFFPLYFSVWVYSPPTLGFQKNPDLNILSVLGPG